jgi:hypothetical protein
MPVWISALLLPVSSHLAMCFVMCSGVSLSRMEEIQMRLKYRRRQSFEEVGKKMGGCEGGRRLRFACPASRIGERFHMMRKCAGVLPRALPIGGVWRMMSQDVAWRCRSSWSRSNGCEFVNGPRQNLILTHRMQCEKYGGISYEVERRISDCFEDSPCPRAYYVMTLHDAHPANQHRVVSTHSSGAIPQGLGPWT